MSKIVLLAALDTKAEDAAFIRDRLRSRGHEVIVVDIGVLGEPGIAPDVDRTRIATAAGVALTDLRRRSDRSEAVEAMATGAARVVGELRSADGLDAAIALGGGAGTTIGSRAMSGLPVGVPKVILTTVAAGDTRGYVGTSDIVLFPSIVDVAGVNRISAITYARAADALAGMIEGVEERATPTRRLVAASMFGVTTPAVMRSKERLETAGCEVVVFHATGTGGRAMERLIEDGLVDGVLDLTTTEWADEVVGGILAAGPDRLSAAARVGVPQVVSLGATDMVNFGPVESVPARFVDRKLYRHNAENTLMRVDVSEARQIGAAIGERLARASRDSILLVPERGVSALDSKGEPFADPAAREALSREVEARLVGASTVVERLDLHVNDEAFADLAAERLLDLMGEDDMRQADSDGEGR